MSKLRKTTGYHTVKCTGCGLPIVRHIVVKQPRCLDCKKRNAVEKLQKQRATYAHSQIAESRYTEGKSDRTAQSTRS